MSPFAFRHIINALSIFCKREERPLMNISYAVGVFRKLGEGALSSFFPRPLSRNGARDRNAIRTRDARFFLIFFAMDPRVGRRLGRPSRRPVFPLPYSFFLDIV